MTPFLLTGAAAAATMATEFCSWNSPDVAAQKLFDLVKLPGDKFPDDVTVIVAAL